MKINNKNRRLYLLINISIVISTLCTIGLITVIYYNNSLRNDEFISRSRFLIKSIEISEEWNKSSGGIYAEKKSVTEFDKHFINSKIKAVTGKEYLLKNSPIMMIEMSRLSDENGFYSFKLRSLKPLNKSNTPDDFEKESLKLFENGTTEQYKKTSNGKNILYRYMTPLYAKSECLTCHNQNDYKTGDIIGGISLSMDITSSEKKAVMLNYFAIISGVFSFIFASGLFFITSSHMKDRLNKSEKKIRILSVTDELTALCNRNYFFQKLKEEFERARRYNYPLSLIIADIDSFKTYNEEHGLHAGDLILKKVADIIKPQCRESDTVSRYGAGEFAVLLPNTGEKGALVIAEKLRSKVEGYRYNENSESVTISLGIASISPDSSYSAETLIYDADTALFRAKESGGNRAVLYNPD